MSTERDFAAQPLDDLDRAVLDSLAEVFRAADPVPAGLSDDIKFAVAELQRLGAESALARSEYTHTQTLTFSAETLSVMVTLSPIDADEVRVDGWVTGHDSAVVIELRAAGGTITAEVDEDGRFTIDPAPRGLVRFVFLPEGELRPVITPMPSGGSIRRRPGG